MDTKILTLSVVLQHLFPVGSSGLWPYQPFSNRDGSPSKPYGTPPLIPFDVFAASAHLLELSGAYHHIVAEAQNQTSEVSRQLRVSNEDIEIAQSIAIAWRKAPPAAEAGPKAHSDWNAPLHKLFEWWEEVFIKNANAPVFVQIDHSREAPSWWKPCLALMMAADEAAAGVGFGSPLDEVDQSRPWFERLALVELFKQMAGKAKPRTNSKAAISVTPFRGWATLSGACQDIAMVLPKARTSSVGCTLRSLSHHLALLPPRGVARGHWTPYCSLTPPSDEQHMNLLLVPFPYTVKPNAFKGRQGHGGKGTRWGFFSVEQNWLGGKHGPTSSDIAKFVETLAFEARKEVDGIHAVVFPELALDDSTYGTLQKELPKSLPELELLVAGVTQKANGRRGNFVSVTVFQRDPKSNQTMLG